MKIQYKKLHIFFLSPKVPNGQLDIPLTFEEAGLLWNNLNRVKGLPYNIHEFMQHVVTDKFKELGILKQKPTII